MISHQSLSGTSRRRARASQHGTSFPSDWNQIDWPYQFTHREEVPDCYKVHNRPLVYENSQNENRTQELLISQKAFCSVSDNAVLLFFF